jgi:hypothetical protein
MSADPWFQSLFADRIGGASPADRDALRSSGAS